MDNNNKHTSPFLFFLCFLLCLVTAALVTRPSAGLSPMEEAAFREDISSGKSEKAGSEIQTEEAVTEETAAEPASSEEMSAEAASSEETAAEAASPEETNAEAALPEETSEAAETAGETPIQESAENEAPEGPEAVPETGTAGNTEAGEQNAEAPAPSPQPAEETPESSYTVSPEAASGYWSKSGSEWFFVTDEGNFHGWFYDTDGHVYYLNPENGVMTTGWLELDGNRYYFNNDGVMQTGDVEVDGQIWHFSSDGVLEGAGSSGEPQPEAVITAAPSKTSSAS